MWQAIKELDDLVLMYYKGKKHLHIVDDWTSSFRAAILALHIKYKVEIPRGFLLDNMSCRLVEKGDEKLIRAYIRHRLLRDLK